MHCNAARNHFSELAEQRSAAARSKPLAFIAGAMLAGGFVAASMILSLSVGSHLAPGARPLAMDGVYGVNMILVTFGGGELFTGQAMFATFAVMRGRLGKGAAMRLLYASWAGNLLGAVLVCGLFAAGGGGQVYGSSTLLHDTIVYKTYSSPLALIARGALCNWVACLGIWTAARLSNEVAKIVVLGWCVLTYVACGFDHAVGDMTTIALGWFAPAPIFDIRGATTVICVSLGNLIGGGLLVAGAYALYSRTAEDHVEPDVAPTAAIVREFVQRGAGAEASPQRRLMTYLSTRLAA